MNLTTKHQIDIDITSIEESVNTFLNAVNAAIHSLNNSHRVFWDLPDDRLTAVLQKLYDSDRLLSLFTNHEYSATVLNKIKEMMNSEGVTAIAIAAREFQIDNDIISLISKPIIEPEAIIAEQSHNAL